MFSNPVPCPRSGKLHRFPHGRRVFLNRLPCTRSNALDGLARVTEVLLKAIEVARGEREDSLEDFQAGACPVGQVQPDGLESIGENIPDTRQCAPQGTLRVNTQGVPNGAEY